MARTADEICRLYDERRRARGVELAKMRDMATLYGGDVVVPLPELGRSEKAAVVNFARMGIDQMGMRCGSLVPELDYPSVARAGNPDGPRKRAATRRRVNQQWWTESKINLVNRKRGRYLFGYATAAVLVRPDFNARIPRWETFSPLDAFGAPTSSELEVVPDDCILAQLRPVSWVLARYPELTLTYKDCKPGDLVDVLTYVDCDEIHLVAARRPRAVQVLQFNLASDSYDYGQVDGVTLKKVVNRAERPLVTFANGIGLEKPVSQFQSLPGMYQVQAELMALGIIARQKSVFAEEWLVSDDNSQVPDVVRKADGRTGEVGIVSGGRFDRWMPHPQVLNDQGLAMLERNQRVEARMPASMSGEAASNVRTGRTVDALMQAATDPTLQEAQEILEVAMHAEDLMAIAIDRGFWRGETKTIYVSTKGYKGTSSFDGEVTYNVDEVWETDRHEVRYPFPGVDVHSLNIAIGQEIGMGFMTKRRGAELSPLVHDAEKVLDERAYEDLEEGLKMALVQQVAVPGSGITLPDYVRVMDLVRDDKMDLAKAFAQVQKEAQERQAQQAPPGAPESMPGVEAPGQGVEAGGGLIAGPTTDQQKLQALGAALTTPVGPGLATAQNA